MNYFQKKLKEKEAYPHKRPTDASYDLKKSKIQRMQKIKKNRQFGML